MAWNKIYTLALIKKVSIFLILFFAVTPFLHSQELEEEKVTLNMNNADIRTFITNIGQILNRTYILDPRINGKVTIISKHPMTQDEIKQLFLSTLNVHGYAVVDNKNNTDKIVPIANVRTDTLTLASAKKPGLGDEYVTRVLKLSNINATKIIPLIRPMVAKEGSLSAYMPSNHLLIIDRADNVKRIVDVIHRLDIKIPNDIDIIPLKHASADDVIQIIDKIESRAKGIDKLASQHVNIVSDKRTNSILLSGVLKERNRIKEIIAKLDSPLQNTSGHIKVIYLHNANAVSLAKVLNNIKDSLDDINTKPLPTIKKISVTPANKDEQQKTNIQADESTNSLIISASPNIMRSLEEVIKQLDIRRAQVLVEAIIVELSDQLSSELGIQWGAIGNSGAVISNFIGSPVSPVSLLSAVDGNSSAIASALGSTNGMVGVLGKGNTRSGFGAIINALSTNGDANILSTPSLIVMDNEEASIIVGQEVPFITGSTTSATNTNPFTTITRKKVGIKLELTPQINEGDAVKLKIYQEVSSVSPAVGASDLITNQREISTTVIVKDNSTIVLGGLKSEESSESVNKIPLLGDIPILGELFKSTDKTNEKRNLMVFIHPIIIRDDEQLNELSGRKYTAIREQQIAQRKEEAESLFSLPSTALLQAWDSNEVLPWKENPPTNQKTDMSSEEL
ncbi:MAG: type II secretion system secretin GspD [Gammaproteobacteria bacterium]|nr:type II secretion system secretin GspD [Gammaproteobacteria bacterium]